MAERYTFTVCSSIPNVGPKIITSLSGSKNPSNQNRRVVLTTISVLYVFAFVNFILQWYLLNWSYITNGETRDTMFRAILLSPSRVEAIIEFLEDFLLVVSDGLLVCNHSWDLNGTHIFFDRYGGAIMFGDNQRRLLQSHHYFWLQRLVCRLAAFG